MVGPALHAPGLAMTNGLLVNLGCGMVSHHAWLNYDMVPQSAGIRFANLAQPLPLADGCAAAVYHAHVLEHLSRPAAGQLLRECHRVLRSRGLLRVVVPDLEAAARSYLEKLEAAAGGRELLPYEWSTLELIDQMVRTEPWGSTGRFLRDPARRADPFVRARCGVSTIEQFEAAENKASARPWGRRLREHRPARFWSRKLREMRLSLARCFLTRSEKEALAEGLFRATGEVHRWMYDRVALTQALQQAGFGTITTVTAHTSAIPDFVGYALDTTAAGGVRRPDSLYCEAVKA